MDRRTKIAVLILAIGLLAVGAVGAAGWYQSSSLTVDEDDDAFSVVANGEVVDTIGNPDTRTIETVREDGAELTAVYVAESSVQSTHHVIVWNIEPDGFWHDVRIRIDPGEDQASSFGWIESTSYADHRLLGGDPETVQRSPQKQLAYPSGVDSGRVDVLIHNTDPAGVDGQTHEFTVELSAQSATGDTISVSVPVEIEYADR